MTAAKRYRDRPPTHATRLVCNCSSRYGEEVRAVAVHSTESSYVPGADNLRGVGTWFDTPTSQASAWIGVDRNGQSVLWVPADKKAWTMGHYLMNAQTLNIEFVGHALQPPKEWTVEQLKTGAKWTAYAMIEHDLPAQRGDIDLVSGQPRIVTKGVIRHKDLTDAGIGTHTDPGWSSDIMHQFLEYVRYYMSNGWTLGVST